MEFADKSRIIESALSWMRARGWHQLLAKRSHFEQSLLEHSLLELDVLLELLPTLSLPNHHKLSKEEQEILCVAVLVHDTGKEKPGWQAYIQGHGPKVGHIDLELTLSVVPEVCSALGIDAKHQSVNELIARCGEFHHNKAGRSDGDIFSAILDGTTDRFLCLAHVIKGIDHFCSAGTASDALRVLRQEPSLGNHFSVTYHQANVRGISTVLLHASARQTFSDCGWKPLLYFNDATVYFAPAESHTTIGARDDIARNLRTTIDRLLSKDVVSLMIGSPTGKILPKPELVNFDESRSYLLQAASRIGIQSFSKKPMEKRRDVVQKYWARKEKQGIPTDQEVNAESMYISYAQPEMIVLKAFKALVNLLVSNAPQSAESEAVELYERFFGPGSWRRLQSTSTLMPDKDMADLIDPYWDLPGKDFEHPDVETLRHLAPQVRIAILIDKLNDVIQHVSIRNNVVSPRAELSEKMCASFLNDLVEPLSNADWKETAASQQKHYSASKLTAGKVSAKAAYLCPICNHAFSSTGGTRASADFVDKPESHTNRASSLGSFDAVLVCNACYYEKLLMQLACGERPQEVIFVIPQLNLGPRHGERLVGRVRTFVASAQLQINGDGEQSQAFYLNVIQTPARKLEAQDPLSMTDTELLSLFLNRVQPEKLKERSKKTIALLKVEFDDDLSEVNARSGIDFSSWEEAATAVLDKAVSLQEFASVRREVFKSAGLHLVCETPNMIMIPLSREISGINEESETSKALRKLFIALVLGISFNARVAIKKDGEPLESGAGLGCAYVAPLPAVRALVGAEWIGIPESLRWLRAIGSASLLSRDTKFPERNALFQVLAAEPAEWLVRRIEQASDSGLVSLKQMRLIEQLPNFTRKYQEE